VLIAALTWLVDPTGPIVRVDLGAPPETGVGWLQPIALGLLLMSILAVVLKRRRDRATGQTGMSGMRSFAFGAAIGNVFLDIGGLLTPDRPSAESIQNLEEEPVDDALGDGRAPPDPEFLHLADLRRGRVEAERDRTASEDACTADTSERPQTQR